MKAVEIDRTDPTHLREHLRDCVFETAPMHRLFCALEALHGFFAPRFVTTLTVLTAVILVGTSLPV